MASLLMAGTSAMTGDSTSPADSRPVSESEPASGLPRSVASEDLFRGQRELLIHHAGEVYRLRLTRNGKLILNK